MLETLNFIQGYPLSNKDTYVISNQQQQLSSFSEGEKHDNNQSTEDFHSKQNVEHDIDKPWKDLLLNPGEWWDVRSTKENSKGAAFERKTNGELLLINSSTCKWLQEKLESMTFDLKPELSYSASGAKKDPASNLTVWRDLLQDPKQWSDYRDSKRNGLVNPKFPDFKHKDGSLSIWLNGPQSGFYQNLKDWRLTYQLLNPNKQRLVKVMTDESWNDLLYNPNKWWDNRSNKKNVKSPDFKHKETGEGLWLNRSPSWVLPKFTPKSLNKV